MEMEMETKCVFSLIVIYQIPAWKVTGSFLVTQLDQLAENKTLKAFA
jgi:hypothetical protein